MTPVYMVDGAGAVVPVPPDQVDGAALAGYSLAAPDQIRAFLAEAERQARFGTPGQQIVTGLEQAGSALTFGLSPAIEQAFGVPAENIRAREEINPVAAGVGTAAGIALPLVLSAGTSAPLSAAEAAGAGARAGFMGAARTAAEATAPSLIARAGRAAAEAVPEMGGLLGRAAPVAAQGAVEGALYAGSDVVERAVLGDPHLTAEKAAAEVGLGALFGGALMGTGKIGAEGFSAIVQKTSEGLRRAAEKVASAENKEALKLVLSDEMRPVVVALDQTAPGAADALASAAYPKTAQYLLENAARVQAVEAAHPGMLRTVLTKATPEEAAFILDNAGGIISGTLERNEIGRALTDKISQTFQQTEGAVRTAWRDARSAEMEALASKADAKAAANQAAGIFDDLAAKVEELKRAPELYTPGSGLRLERIGEGLVRDATANPAETYLRLNRLKQSLDDLIPWGAEASTAAGRDTTALLKDLRGKVKSALEDTAVWGEAGERQQAFNKAFQGYKDAAKRLGAGKSGTLEARILRKVDDGAGGITYEANEKTVNAWLNAMADARGGKKSDAFNAFLDKAEALAGEMGKSGYAGAQDLSTALRQMRSDFAGTEYRATVNQVVNRLRNPGQILVSEGYIPTPAALAREAGAAVLKEIPGAGVITRTATATVDKLRSPSMLVGLLGGLDALAQKTARAVSGGVARIFGEAAEAGAAAGAGEAASRVTRENFRHVAGTLSDLGSNLDRVADLTGRSTGDLQPYAPASVEALTALAARGLGHVGSRLPKGPAKLTLDADYIPSASELAAFNHAFEIAERPARALEHIARGTYSSEHHQALQTIYPRLAEEMKLQVLEHLAKDLAKGKRLPRRTRITLSLFLGADLESSTTGQAIADAQAAWAAQPLAESQAPAPRPDVKIDPGAALSTGMQRSRERLS